MCGTAICSFGIYNVHDQSGITEGGALGLVLLLNHWFDIPSSLATPIIDIVCYVLAFRALGRQILRGIRHIHAEHGHVFQNLGALPPCPSQP